MGQKVNPIGLRVGVIKDWQSRWYANKKDFVDFLHKDLKMRKYIKKKLAFAGISKVEFERAGEKTRVKIYAARPGLIIGRKGSEVDKLKDEMFQITKGPVLIDIHEVKKTELDAQLVSDMVASQLEKRASFRRVMKKAVTNCLNNGGLGIKISCSGRLGGAEMARREGYKEGKVPLHTLRADIDYGFSEANTTYGIIGVKVWIFKGEILGGMHSVSDTKETNKENTKFENKKPENRKFENRKPENRKPTVRKNAKEEKPNGSDAETDKI
ncbi:30S ribosomal protein S3 [bacterium]|nr:30S ribosomal protein S3 [bacterium]